MSDIALDNDVVLKGACFRLTAELWPPEGPQPGVLGAAPFVLRSAIERLALRRDKAEHAAELAAFFERTSNLEPSPEEIKLAAGLETAAAEANLELDVGEAQLAAMSVCRDIDSVHTGDKRAIAALESLQAGEPRLKWLMGRVRCLEQLIAELIAGGEAHRKARAGVCDEPVLDTALRTCFSCTSGQDPGWEAVSQALGSYVSDLRADAPTMLAPT